jgi:hypothetical protein
MQDKQNEIILYQPDNTIEVEVRLDGETVWLTQAQIAQLFGTEIPAISKHINNIYNVGELDKSSTFSFLEIVQYEGQRVVKRKIAHYNLDMILSVGYRVNSMNATQFRRWATKVLKEYMLKGFAINHRFERLENFAIETNRRLTDTEYEIRQLKLYLETVLAEFDDINENTRTQLELINQALAELQSYSAVKPRKPIGFKISEQSKET